jgi:peptidoglycan/LPS O-acetylase OafA/YrhL
MCTVLTVVVLGALLTSLPLLDYFSHPTTRGYFSNIALYITFHLPGVFETNRYANAVNGSLWSLPAEFSMYLALAVLGLLRVPRAGWVAVAVGLMLASRLWAMKSPDMLVFYRTDLRLVVNCGVYFWVGAVYYRFGLQRIFSITTIFAAIIVWLCLSRWIELFAIASWVFLPFLSLAFGLASNSWLSRLAKYDYSYGIYIYAFPIEQTVAKLWPNMPLGPYLALSCSATLALAALSWHWIERPALRLKPTQRAASAQESAPNQLQHA